MRSDASITSERKDCIGPLSSDGKIIPVKITGEKLNNYYPVMVNGQTGYMSATFIGDGSRALSRAATNASRDNSKVAEGPVAANPSKDSAKAEGPVATNLNQGPFPINLPTKDELINPPIKPTSGNAIKHLTNMAASNKACLRSYVKHRGPIRSAKGAFYGLVTTMARSICRSNNDIIKTAMMKGGGSARRDIFVYHGLGRSSQKQIMVNLYGLLLGHVFKETTGRYWLGVDILNKRSMRRAVSAEGGLCQTSYDIHGRRSSLGTRAMLKVVKEYEKNRGLCLKSVFATGMKVRRGRRLVGGGIGARFQSLMRSCPAAAIEHCAIAVRHSRRHYGPLRKQRSHSKASKSLPACQKTFSKAYDYVQQNRRSVCPQLGIRRSFPMAKKQKGPALKSVFQ